MYLKETQARDVFCMFELMFYVPINYFSAMSSQDVSFLEQVLSRLRIKCLARGYNSVLPVMLEPVTQALYHISRGTQKEEY